MEQNVTRSALSLLHRVRAKWQRYTPYEDYFDLRTTEFVLLQNGLRRAGVMTPPRRVLEVGCGMGYSLLLWSMMGSDAIGMDGPVSLQAARQLHADFPPSREVGLVEGHGESIPDSLGSFDLVTSQYVLEHVRDIGKTVQQMNARVMPGGFAVHILNSLVDRHAAYVEYRHETQVHYRLREAADHWGKRKALRYAFAFTPPHEPRFGDFSREHSEYRLEKWALRLMEHGCEIVDHFQTRDVNWVLVTRPIR